MECDYLNGWIKKRSHTQKSHPKVVNPRDTAGERKKKKPKKTTKKAIINAILTLSNSRSLAFLLYHVAHDMVHMVSSRCVACDLHTTAWVGVKNFGFTEEQKNIEQGSIQLKELHVCIMRVQKKMAAWRSEVP